MGMQQAGSWAPTLTSHQPYRRRPYTYTRQSSLSQPGCLQPPRLTLTHSRATRSSQALTSPCLLP